MVIETNKNSFCSFSFLAYAFPLSTSLVSFTFSLLSFLIFVQLYFCNVFRAQFLSILRANFILSFSTQLNKDADGCGSVYASADIAEDEVFLTLPYDRIVITDALARKSLPLPPSSSSAQLLDSRTTLILFLIQQQIAAVAAENQSNDQQENEKVSGSSAAAGSFFQPYLDMVPDKIHTALEFDDQDMEHLRGTNAFLVVKELKENLRAKYDKIMEVVGSELTIEKGYTWERFLWAETVVSSRTFPASLFGHQVENEIVLIPLAGKFSVVVDKLRT